MVERNSNSKTGSRLVGKPLPIPVVIETAVASALAESGQLEPGRKRLSRAERDSGKQDLMSLNLEGMRAFVEELGEKPYRATQLLKWIYQQQVLDFELMTDLSKKSRIKLTEAAEIKLPAVQLDSTASDGTRKWLFQLADGNSIETVFIPDGARGTLCISSQVGCALDCSFCATGRQGFNRNLTTAEIIAQLWLANKLLGESANSNNEKGTPNQPSSQKNTAKKVTNVVMMGMGEPLLNFAALVPALDLMMDDLSFGLSKRKVTVSTSGVVPAMDRLDAAIDCSLAVSLHAPNDELRDQLVPLNRKYPIADLMAACQRYVDGDRRKHVFFEYVLLAGVNDKPEHARELVSLLRDFPAKVNLIPFNPFEESGYQRSSENAIRRFWQILTDGGVLTLRRATRGDDIDAACGQLAGEIEDRSRRHRRFEEPRFGEQFPR